MLCGSNNKNVRRPSTSGHLTQMLSSRLRNQSWAKLVPCLETKDVCGKALPAETVTELKIEANSLDLLPLEMKAKTREQLNNGCSSKKAAGLKQLPAPALSANRKPSYSQTKDSEERASRKGIGENTNTTAPGRNYCMNRCARKCLRKTKTLQMLQQPQYWGRNGHSQSDRSCHKSTALQRSQSASVVFAPQCISDSTSLPPLNIAKIPSDFQPLGLKCPPLIKKVSPAENLKWREMLSRGSFKPLESRDLPTSGEVLFMKSRTWEKFEPSSCVIRYAKFLDIAPASTVNGRPTIHARESRSFHEPRKNSQSIRNCQGSLSKGDLIQLHMKSGYNPAESVPFVHANSKSYSTMRCIADRGFVITPCCPPSSSLRPPSPGRPGTLGQLPESTEGDSEVDEGIGTPSPGPSTPSIDEHVLNN